MEKFNPWSDIYSLHRATNYSATRRNSLTDWRMVLTVKIGAKTSTCATNHNSKATSGWLEQNNWHGQGQICHAFDQSDIKQMSLVKIVPSVCLLGRLKNKSQHGHTCKIMNRVSLTDRQQVTCYSPWFFLQPSYSPQLRDTPHVASQSV